MRLPVNSPYQMTQSFGYDPSYPLNNGFHKGVDLVSDDKLVIMPEDGKVEVRPNDGNCGNAIYFTNGNNRHAFCHLSKFLVSNGADVKAGTPIGVMGKTGAANGIHLHWALKYKGEFTNPLSLVKENDMHEGHDAKYWYETWKNEITAERKAHDETRKSRDSATAVAEARDRYLKDIGKRLGKDYKIVDAPQVAEIVSLIEHQSEAGAVELKPGKYIVKG